MKMYADYIKETLGDETLIREEGFATYRFLDDNGVPAVYVIDIYVRPDFRKTMIASQMADEIIEIAKAKGCKIAIGTVLSTTKDPNRSLGLLLGYGMKFFCCNQTGMIFKKEI